jgi:type IV pilus assembly protein PilW
MISSNRGFGLVEIMVGLVVGLVTMIVIMQVLAVFESQKRATTSGDDAQTAGALALYVMEREIRAAGNGMTEGVPQQLPPLAGCMTHVYDRDGAYLAPNATAPFVSIAAGAGTSSLVRMAPVLVSDGGAGSDSVSIIYGTSSIVAPLALSADYTPGAVSLGLISTAGIAKNDMIALVDKNSAAPAPSKNYLTPKVCSLLQATDAPAAGAVAVATSRYNLNGSPLGLTTFSGNTTQVYNLGQLNIVTYRISGKNLVADIAKFGVVPDGTVNPLGVANRTDFSPLAANIVSMKIQYGIDTGNPMGTIQTNCKMNTPGASLSASDSDAVVDAWVNATGTWANIGTTTPTLFDLRRIRAVRIGLVARSPVKASGKADDLCDASAVKIHWDSGPDMTPDLSATDTDWKCYRYKVFQTTIPVRNALWSSTMNPASSASCGLRDPG